MRALCITAPLIPGIAGDGVGLTAIPTSHPSGLNFTYRRRGLFFHKKYIFSLGAKCGSHRAGSGKVRGLLWCRHTAGIL